jgi:fatty-acyl-CoA synthase
MAEPLAFRNVGEAVLSRSGGGGAMVFHVDDDAIRLETDELIARGAACAARLVDLGVRAGDAVGVLGPNRPEWPSWALGVWLAGGALVPLPAPVRVRDAEAYSLQIRSLLDAVGCRLVATDPKFAAAVPEERLLLWNTATPPVRELPTSVDAAPDDTAMILCTSGSTSAPKGIRLTNSTLLTRAGAVPGMSRTLSWLPLFHAAGNAGMWAPVFNGAECHVMLAEAFARDPGAWFRMVGAIDAQAIGAASSAFAAATRAVARRPEGVDLSSIELAMFVLEMVDPDVIDRFVEVCAPLGLRPETLAAAYGLSEGAGTMTAWGEGIRIDTVDLEELVTAGRAVAPIGDRPAKRVASCGRAAPPTELAVGNPRDPLPDRSVGEIFFRGTGMMLDGYVKRDAEVPIEGGWLRTGDLGYVADGDLFVTGRTKEIIVHFGRNYHPEDIEWAALRVAGVLPGGCVAFADPRGEEGAVIVLVESERDDGLSTRVRAGITNAIGLTPREICVVPTGAIPKAANGKIQRLAARDAYARSDYFFT